MAKCTLSVEIENPREQYVPGDVIDVIVHVETTDSVKCSALTLEFGWETHGTGNCDSDEFETQTLFDGQWSPGDELGYRAQVTVPRFSQARPASYHGRHINVDWHLRARADIPWAFDPKAEARIFLAPDAGTVPPYERPSLWPTEPVKLAGNSGCLIVLTVIAFVAGGFLVMHKPWIGAACFAGGLFAAIFTWKENELRKRIGDVGFGFAPDRPAIGGELHAFAEIAPPGRLDIESVTMTLAAEEVAVSGSGTQRTTHRHKAFEQAVVQAEHQTVSAGDTLELDFSFELPVDLPPSFEGDDNSIEWTLDLDVKAMGAKELTATKELTVGHVIRPRTG